MRKWLKSSVWVHGEYGIKEAEAAKFIRQGRPILLVYDSDFRGLLQDKTPARVADRVAGQPFVWACTSNEEAVPQSGYDSGSS